MCVFVGRVFGINFAFHIHKRYIYIICQRLSHESDYSQSLQHAMITVKNFTHFYHSSLNFILIRSQNNFHFHDCLWGFDHELSKALVAWVLYPGCPILGFSSFCHWKHVVNIDLNVTPGLQNLPRQGGATAVTWAFPLNLQGGWCNFCVKLSAEKTITTTTLNLWVLWHAELFLRHELTHWGWDKMAAIFQTAFSNVFSWMKMYEFQLKFPWTLFLRVQLTISQHWFI